MDTKTHIKPTLNEYIREIIESELKRYLSWDELNSDIKTDIIENIYHNSIYLQKEWNIWTFKEYVDDATNLPKFKIEYKDVDELYEQLKQIGWGISETNVKNLMNIFIRSNELEPVLLNNGNFFDGGHRLTAYKRLRKELIPTIDIGIMLGMDWEKWFNVEVN
jgi:hypothetical protein